MERVGSVPETEQDAIASQILLLLEDELA